MATTMLSYQARTTEPFGTAIQASTAQEVDDACQAAADAFPGWAGSNGTQRGRLLRALADMLEEYRQELVPLADEETALGTVRLNGELDRTAFQLRRFATIAEQGIPYAYVDDPAVAGPPPAGHPSMMRTSVPLGPVAMFSASNFPFAFSVLGGDTASALAAGCPVVVKAHSGHLLLSRRVYALARDVLARLGLHQGLLGLVIGAGNEVGVHLISHPAIAAGAFTGSTRGGAALQAHANARKRPIPFYGELGSVNPVVALPAALDKQGPELANMLAASIALGCGQFCTSPGVIITLPGAASDEFVRQLSAALAAQSPHAMLTSAMRAVFDRGISEILRQGAQPLLHEETAEIAPRPFLATVSAQDFLGNESLHEEVFGPASLIVQAQSAEEAANVLAALGGSLTVTLWGADGDTPENRMLVRAAQRIAGRILFSGVPTGVAVTAAQQHGGPWPSSTQAQTTSVGDAALQRFLRPVALQDMPAWLVQMGGQPC